MTGKSHSEGREINDRFLGRAKATWGKHSTPPLSTRDKDTRAEVIIVHRAVLSCRSSEVRDIIRCLFSFSWGRNLREGKEEGEEGEKEEGQERDL